MKTIGYVAPKKAGRRAVQGFFIITFAVFYKIGIPRLNDKSFFRHWLIVPKI